MNRPQESGGKLEMSPHKATDLNHFRRKMELTISRRSRQLTIVMPLDKTTFGDVGAISTLLFCHPLQGTAAIHPVSHSIARRQSRQC